MKVKIIKWNSVSSWVSKYTNKNCSKQNNINNTEMGF